MASEFEALVRELRAVVESAEERPEKAQRAAAAVRRVGGYRWVGLYDVSAAEISVIGWAGPSAPTHPTFPRTQGLNGAAVASGEPVVVQDVSQDARYLATLSSTRAEMIVPVRASPDGAVVGTIDVESDRVQPFTTRDRTLLSACVAALTDLWSGDMTTRDTVQGYFSALKQKQGWESFLSDDMTFTSFTSPIKRVRGKAAYLESTKRFYSMITAFDVRDLLVDGQKACALTEYQLRPPKGPGFTSDVAEVFEVRDGKIRSFDIYFDSSPFPK